MTERKLTNEELTEVPSVVYQSNMRRGWWIAFSWEDITEASDNDRKYLRCLPRPISEVREAALDFDMASSNFSVLRAKE